LILVLRRRGVAPPKPVAAAKPSPPSQPERLLRVQDDALSHVGRVREINEDSHFASAERRVWAVADGMGGHEFGERASRAIVEALELVPVSNDLNQTIDAVRTAVAAANGAVYAESQQLGQRMGSTVVALAIDDREYSVLWAGDSRAYLYRNGELKRISRDHTQVQALVDSGALTEAEAEHHPMSHVLVRAIGVLPEIDVDEVRAPLQANDIFLLCSDGLYGLVSDAEIAERLTPSRLGEAAEALIALSLERGAPDNVTAIAIAASEATLLSFGNDRMDSK
jgi:serine/threonine protein phosphatase PrpC